MSDDVLSNYGGNLAAAVLAANTKYLGLHLSPPTLTGLLASEVAGGAYVRQPLSMSVPASKTIVSTNAQIFPGMPACTILWLAGWDAIAAGHMIWAKKLIPGIAVLESGQLLTKAGDIAVSL